MPLPPFDKILFEPRALKYLGALPQPVRECLKGVIADIKQRRIELETPITWRMTEGPWFATACQHVIYASENRRENVLVILEMMPDIADDDDDIA